jgi:hypothetical protein
MVDNVVPVITVQVIRGINTIWRKKKFIFFVRKHFENPTHIEYTTLKKKYMGKCVAFFINRNKIFFFAKCF